MNTKPESKFIHMAEVLPNNAKTAAILKAREEKRIKKEEEEKIVSNLKSLVKQNARFKPLSSPSRGL